eukprot:3444412-Prymnesium_polylepis.2
MMSIVRDKKDGHVSLQPDEPSRRSGFQFRLSPKESTAVTLLYQRNRFRTTRRGVKATGNTRGNSVSYEQHGTSHGAPSRALRTCVTG